MKFFLTVLFALSISICSSCDLRSGIAKKNMEKYELTPTPFIPPPTPEPPVDPADVVQVDTSLQGDRISINEFDQIKTANCNKFNRLILNGHRNRITVTGACSEIVVNGDDNELTANATVEFVVNGSGNTITYAKLANGKRPLVTESQTGNIIEKAPPASDTNTRQKGGTR